MRLPGLVASPGAPDTSLAIRLMWMALYWVAGVGCVLVVSLILRAVLHS